MARNGFAKMSVKELLEAQVEIEELLEIKKREERDAIKEKLASLAEASGFSVGELFGTGRKGALKGSKVAPKYRNPANPTETWSGRGRQPLWLAAALKKGLKLEKFLIG
jgi:DNA-binding protein H-NS